MLHFVTLFASLDVHYVADISVIGQAIVDVLPKAAVAGGAAVHLHHVIRARLGK